jgi:hypothetical protein
VLIPPLYDNISGNDVILQGDIFPEIDFFITNTEINPDKINSFQISERRMVSIISQTCDVSESDFIVVSPIYTIDEYVETLKQRGEKANAISSNVGYIKSRKSLLDKFYLTSLEIMPETSKECYIDLRQINTISKKLCPLHSRIASLSHWGRHVLNYQLTWVYGRPIINW